MIFNLSQLLQELTGATRHYEIDEAVELPIGGEPTVQLTGSAEFVRTPDGLLARADLTGEAAAVCARCLAPATFPLRLHVEEVFVPTVDPFTGAHLPPPADPGVFQIDEHHHLDLVDAVRQQAVLEEPLRVLCRPECRGLCPRCGADLNEVACACAESDGDERWAALRKLSTG